MINHLILRRDDFVKLSDGSSMFDQVLSSLNIDATFQPEIHEVSIEIDKGTVFKMWDENSKRRVVVFDRSAGTTKLDVMDD